MTQKGYNETCRANLQVKRERLRNQIETNKLPIDEAGKVFAPEYLRFLEYAAELDMALTLEQWENADEITDTLMDLPPFKDNLRYIAIICKLLEDFNV